MDIVRVTPGVSYDTDFARKGVITNMLMPYYRTVYPSAHFNYTNYLAFNFFRENDLPNDSALLFVNPVSESGSTITAPYLPDGAFTFDFWIKPTRTAEDDVHPYQAGTLMHLSSCYAVSVVSGSSRDANNVPDKFRILLQLSSSAGIAPSLINTSSLPPLSFLMDDNSLFQNTWHHVSIRWGTNAYNNGTGSFVVDGNTKGIFAIPSASVKPPTFFGTSQNPNVLVVGNYYEGDNDGTNSMAYWFSTDTRIREGLEELIADTGFKPFNWKLDHILNAEFHDLKLYNTYLTNPQIETLRTQGPQNTDNLLFYLPPFFTTESPNLSFYEGQGGVFQTPFFTTSGSTDTPFNTGLAYAVGGHYVCLENHGREFVNGRYPRLWSLTGSLLNNSTVIEESANDILYATGSVRRRACAIVPCDNGQFLPNFQTFLGNLNTDRFLNDLGNTDIGSVSLRNIISTASLYPGLRGDGTGSIAGNLSGPDPAVLSSMDVAPGYMPTILQRTQDNSSNQVVMFDISNLYYGNTIKPGTLVIRDDSLGYGRMTLKDDGLGNLYRGDTSGSQATWNSVGNVFYNEGLVLIKSPYLYFFGDKQFSVSFQGEQNIHVLKFSITARPFQQISSSNPSYLPVDASDMANDADKSFTYITGINLHDDNLNVIAKTSLAQPVVCRSGDKLNFKVKMDF